MGVSRGGVHECTKRNNYVRDSKLHCGSFEVIAWTKTSSHRDGGLGLGILRDRWPSFLPRSRPLEPWYLLQLVLPSSRCDLNHVENTSVIIVFLCP